MPYILTWKVGNIRLPALVTIISVPNSLNSSHSGFISKLAIVATSFGCKGFLICWEEFELFSGKSADEQRSVPDVGAPAVVVGVVVVEEPANRENVEILNLGRDFNLKNILRVCAQS